MMSEREPALLGVEADGPSESTDKVTVGDTTDKVTARHDDAVTDRTVAPRGAVVSAADRTSASDATGAPAARPSRRPAAPALDPPARPSSRREPPAVHVVGFWKRLAAAMIDLAIVVPVALVITWIASRIGGVHLPPTNMRVIDVDMWIDLVLATDPALVMGVALTLAVGLIYLLVFQIVLGQTVGMRLLKIRIIDVYGDRPSPARCIARCAGYLAGLATLFLGFLWMGFDSEKRGVQDWIAGTYVIRA